ncbi:MAG TPA: hypothetical protein VFQ53_26585 [Kofleriaceae bacterium]|nr:hypothetical protein [Kofleriaceae bacterium]
MRALVLSCAVLAGLAAVPRLAAADDKPKIAILGLDVAGNVDMESSKIATDLTNSLRAQVKSSRFTIAPNSNKDLIEEKLANGCESEATDCMATIGKKYKAAYLLYGRVEKKGSGYLVTLKLLDIEKKTTTPWNDTLGDSSKVETFASKGFAGVTGQDEPTVVTEPKDKDVTPIDTTKPPATKRPGGGWRTTAYVAGGTTVLLAGAFAYSWNELRQTGGSFPTYGGKCTKDPMGNVTGEGNCKNGSSLVTRTYVTGIGMGVVGGIALVAAYKGFLSSKKESSQPTGVTGKSTRKKSRFAVTPILAPDGAGATVQFDW